LNDDVSKLLTGQTKDDLLEAISEGQGEETDFNDGMDFSFVMDANRNHLNLNNLVNSNL